MGEHSYNELMTWDKQQLVQHIINLEHCINLMQERMNRQANNIRCLIKMEKGETDEH